MTGDVQIWRRSDAPNITLSVECSRNRWRFDVTTTTNNVRAMVVRTGRVKKRTTERKSIARRRNDDEICLEREVESEDQVERRRHSSAEVVEVDECPEFNWPRQPSELDRTRIDWGLTAWLTDAPCTDEMTPNTEYAIHVTWWFHVTWSCRDIGVDENRSEAADDDVMTFAVTRLIGE